MRPSFEDILISLDDIVHSDFTQASHESFHTMQDVWKVEIEHILDELKIKEKVSNTSYATFFLNNFKSNLLFYIF